MTTPESWCLLIFDVSLFIEWEIVSINSSSIVMTVLLDWMSIFYKICVMYF